MKGLKHRTKVILTDTLGVMLIILSPLLGWLPGPGGIPMFFAGLGLLSINHEWARRLLEYLKTEGAKVISKIFSENPIAKAIYDVVSAALIVIGIYLINTYTRNLTLSLAVFCLATGLALFLGNRHRLQNLIKRYKK